MATRGTFQSSVRTMLRDQLLDAARDLLIHGGWSQVRMADVAREVGVSRQTVYNEFGTKEGLGEAVALREADRFLLGISERLDEHTDNLAEAIRAAVAFTLSAAADNPVLKAVLTATRGGADELLPFFTTRSEPILNAAVVLLLDYLDSHWPDLDLSPDHRRFVLESIVRLVISHLVMPLAPPDEIARQLAWLAGRVIDFPQR
ncbi:MAG: TetR family transcriptional regulator [Micromonosporaceae bacterium]